MKKTKVICTMGPNSDDPQLMRNLMLNGMDIARFNFSHGDHEEQRARLNLLKATREELQLPIAALLDTKGPEIRTGLLKDEKKVTLVQGQTYTLTPDDIVGDETIGHITYDRLHEDVSAGSTILIDDGLLELRVTAVEGKNVVCQVINGGELGMRKGVNVPNVKVQLPAITEKDKADILFGIQEGFDFIAASFVRSAKAIHEIREILNANGSAIKIIAKIENKEGLDNLSEIIEASDGIMVARGDLGVEIPAQEVPFIQKTIIRECNSVSKPVITATQMLDSMIRMPRPTRAEVTDVANAIYDGTDAIMLSGETAAGKYPLEALKMMVQIAKETESHISNASYKKPSYAKKSNPTISSVVCYTSIAAANDLNATAIVAPSITGYTARMLSKWRCSTPIYGLSPNMTVVRQMQLYWGVIPHYGKRASSTDELVISSLDTLKNCGVLKNGDLVIFTAGVTQTPKDPHKPAVHTNNMRVIPICDDESEMI